MLAMVFLSGSLGRSGSLRLNLTRRRFAHTTHWLIAAATHRQLGMSYEEASDALQHVDASMLDEFAAELAKGGQQVVASTAQVTVLDSAVAEETSGPSRPTRSWLRSLHFNDRLDYVQSCVRVKGAAKFRAADHSQPPPAHGATATHLHLLLVAVGLHRAIVSHTGRPLAEDLRIAVLGAGGCSVPAYLATALRLPGGRRAEIDAVELNKDVVAAARTYFGIQNLEETNDKLPNRLRVHTQCALAWVKAAPKSVDVLIVDLESGNSTGDRHLGACEVHAPPLAATDLDFLRDVARLVGSHLRPGVVAFNCIATPEGLIKVQERVRQGLSLAKAEQHAESTSGAPATTHDDDLQMWVVAPDVEIEHSDVLHRVLLFQLGGRLSGEFDSQGAITEGMRTLGLQPSSFVLQKVARDEQEMPDPK